MIKSVEITNYRNESILFELAFPEKSGFAIQDIQGLGPAKAVINATELSTMDGSLYNSSRVSSRNIVFSLIFLEHPTIEATRQKSYKFFSVKKPVKLTFKTDNRLAEIYGYVESNEPVIFSEQETTQISIICPDPYFYLVGEKAKQTTEFAGFEPAFSFPFSNESLTEKLLFMGHILINQIKNIIYEGDSEIGIEIDIIAIGEVENLVIYNPITLDLMKIDTDKLIALTGSPIILGDEIHISTIKGQKSIELLRNGAYINILNCLDRDVSWFQLSKGDNIFSFNSSEGSTNIIFKITNQTIFEGI